jgi:parallel beta helix pectate lyase-like protein
MVLLWVSAVIVAGAAVAITTIPGQPLTAAQSAQLRPLPRCHRHHHHCRPRPAPTPTSPSPTPTSPAPTPTTPGPTPTSTASPTPPPPPPPPPGSAPSDPPAQICGNSALLNGPSSPPAGAVTVPAGDDRNFEASFDLKPNTTYWFAPGVHTLGSGEFAQIQPREGDTFIGAPGAILSGQGQNDSAFAMDEPNVTIEYLTIQDFTPPGSQGAVNHDSGRGWTISHNTIQNNSPGAALILGSDNTATFNCLTHNGEYGFNAEGDGAGHSTLTGGPNNITLSNNEISFNDTCNFEEVSPNPVPASMRPSNCAGGGGFDGCGCSGAGKFWEVDNATVNSNYVHDNFDVGLWADTNDNGFTFKGNYIKNNWSVGLLYELSYNADIEDNTFIGNAIGAGPTNPGFPEGAIYLSESGGDSRVPNTAGISTVTVSGNTFTNNWSGVVLWENADRFCGSPDNSSTGTCTLVQPSVANINTCNQANLQGATASASPDYYDLCRWKTQNVQVTGNTFNLDESAVPGCKGSDNSCGQNAVFSQYGTQPGWSPYKAFAISEAITTARNNKFSGNTYNGPWSFMYHDQSTVLSMADWKAKGQD